MLSKFWSPLKVNIIDTYIPPNNKPLSTLSPELIKYLNEINSVKPINPLKIKIWNYT